MLIICMFFVVTVMKKRLSFLKNRALDFWGGVVVLTDVQQQKGNKLKGAANSAALRS
jgi:hypothetical protein